MTYLLSLQNMSKSELTIARLENALQRILDGKPLRVSIHRKLSIKCIEEEASLGDGSAYYYENFVDKVRSKIKTQKNGKSPPTGDEKVNLLKSKLKREISLKESYRKKVEEQKQQLASMAAQQNQFAIQAQSYLERIAELESGSITSINKND